MIPTPTLGETLYTRPSELKKLVTPETLRIPGNFYVTDTFNFLEDHGVFNGTQLSDDDEYSLKNMTVQPFRHTLPDVFGERPVSLHTVQGEPDTEGAAFVAIVGDVEDGMLIREHSACAYSEMGRLFTNQFYNEDPAKGPLGPNWFCDNVENLMPSFAQYGDGIVTGYPTADNLERSLDCDCRAQRKLAQFIIAAQGGIYVSLAGRPQEGRGFGPVIKEKIYRLQEQGMSTAMACHALGLPPDVRQYRHVVRLVKELGLKCVSIMTNNPRKVWPYIQAGIKVIRIPLIPAYLTHEARRYVVGKGEELGHELEERSDFIFNEGKLTVGRSPSFIGLPKYVASSDVKLLVKTKGWLTGEPQDGLGRRILGEYTALCL